MTSYRDLADADAFERRRLVTAFISGDPSGGLVQPPRACACLLAGLILVAVLGAGAAVSGVVTGHPSVARDHGTVRISR